MGNPRKPDAMKRLEGTWRADRSNPDQPDLDPVDIPSAPKHLAEDERKIWNAFRKFMQPLGIVAEPDLYSFEQMVRWVARANRLWANPETTTKELDACNKNVKQWLGAFGMTPSDRAKVKRLVEEDDAQTLEDFLGVAN